MAFETWIKPELGGAPPQAAAIRFGSGSICFNKAAVEESGFKRGDRVVVLYDPETATVAFKKSDDGWKLTGQDSGLRFSCVAFLERLPENLKGKHDFEFVDDDGASLPGCHLVPAEWRAKQ